MSLKRGGHGGDWGTMRVETTWLGASPVSGAQPDSSGTRDVALSRACVFPSEGGGGGGGIRLPDRRRDGLRPRSLGAAPVLYLLPRRLGLWFFAACASSLAAAAPVSAATLISNHSQTHDTSYSLGSSDLAQAFTTGSNALGYELTGIEFVVWNARNPVTYSGGIWSSDEEVDSSQDGDSIDEPHTSLGALTCPALVMTASGAINASRTYECTTTGINLEAGKTYLFVLDNTSSETGASTIRYAEEGREDSGGASGWSIENQSIHRLRDSTGNWSALPKPMRIHVKGSVKMANRAPTVANEIPDQTATVGVAFSYAFPTNAFADADGDALTYAAVKSDGSALPSWLSFAAATRTFSGTPQASDAGAVSVKVTASDGDGESVSDVFDITVTAKPARPTGFQAVPGDGRATLSWDDPSDATITGYKYQRRKGSFAWSAWVPVEGSDASTTSNTFTGLDNGIEYRYRIRAVNAAGDGAQSVVKRVTPMAVVSLSVADVASSEGGAFAFTVSATPTPAAAVSFQYAVTAESGDTATAGVDFTAVSPARSATIAANASATTITVSVVDDSVAESDETFTVTLSMPSAGATLGDSTATGTIRDDDSIGVTVSPETLTVAEGGSGSYTVRLNTEPTGSVTVSVGGASGDVSASPLMLTFTTANHATAQTVTVSAAEDDDRTADAAVTLTHSATGGGYGTVTIASVTVSVTENDGPAAPEGFRATAGDRRVSLSWSNPGDATITRYEYQQKTGGSFGANWTPIPNSGASTTSHTVRSLTNDTAYTFRIRAVSPAGNGAASPEKSATPRPAPAGVTVSPEALTVSEGGSGTYTVALDAKPSGAVTVSVGGASGDVSVSPSSLTFTTGNWSTARTVTVSAAEDEDAVADAAVTLTHAASGGGYGSVTIASVVVSVSETTPTLRLLTDPAAVTEGEDILLTVSSDRALTGMLTVSLTLSDRGDGGFTAEDVPGGLGPRSFEAVFGATASRTGTASIPTGADSDEEGMEAYRITLNDATGYAVGGDSTAEGALSDGVVGSAARANRVNEKILPQVAAAALSQSLGVITDRIERVASGVGEGSSGLGALAVGGGSSPKLRDLLPGASFVLPLGATEGGGKAVSVWGRGDWTDLEGSESGVDWDGEVWSAHVGADLRLRPDLLAGAAVSYSESDLDAETDGMRSVYETRLTSVSPYVAWLFEDGSSLWASVGYGRGEVRVREEGGETREADLRMRSVAAGGRRALSEISGSEGKGATRLALKGEASLARARTDADDGLAGLSVDASRLRVALEVSHERVLEGGGTLIPALEAGARHDGGDAADGVGAELGASLAYRDPARGFSAEIRARALVAHGEDRDEWGASGILSLAPGAHGRGPSLSLGLSRGETESGIGRLFEREPSGLADSDEARARYRLEAEIGHGFAGPGPAGLVSPYAGLTLEEAGARSVRLGARYRLTDAFSLSVEARRHLSGVIADGANEIVLRGSLRW